MMNPNAHAADPIAYGITNLLKEIIVQAYVYGARGEEEERVDDLFVGSVMKLAAFLELEEVDQKNQIAACN